eukprot:23168-Amphidinium_carterae.1
MLLETHVELFHLVKLPYSDLYASLNFYLTLEEVIEPSRLVVFTVGVHKSAQDSTLYAEGGIGWKENACVNYGDFNRLSLFESDFDGPCWPCSTIPMPPCTRQLKGKIATEARGQAAVALKTLASNNTYNKVPQSTPIYWGAGLSVVASDCSHAESFLIGKPTLLSHTSNALRLRLLFGTSVLHTCRKQCLAGMPNNEFRMRAGAIPLLIKLLKESAFAILKQTSPTQYSTQLPCLWQMEELVPTCANLGKA